MIGLQIGSCFYEIGNGGLFHCFFSTIAYQLEENDWGSEFPLIMNKLYNGELSHEFTDEALRELKMIKDEFSNYSPKAVIWDIEDLDKTPPWGNEIAEHITNLSNYFVTNNGKDLFDVIEEVLSDSKRVSLNITVRNL